MITSRTLQMVILPFLLEDLVSDAETDHMRFLRTKCRLLIDNVVKGDKETIDKLEKIRLKLVNVLTHNSSLRRYNGHEALLSYYFLAQLIFDNINLELEEAENEYRSSYSKNRDFKLETKVNSINKTLETYREIKAIFDLFLEEEEKVRYSEHSKMKNEKHFEELLKICENNAKLMFNLWKNK